MHGRFVIQQHSGFGPTHFDLMLETGEALATRQLASLPSNQPGQSMPARKLPDHRSAYLTYEGPVSGGRGEVRIVERGSWRAVSTTPARWEVDLAGEVLAGRYVLEHVEAEQWTLAREA